MVTARKKPTAPKGKANPIDVHIGRQLHLCRIGRSMSQEKLAVMSKVTFQQIQKYEKGTNRIAASRLYLLSVILRVPVGYFFDGLTPADIKAAGYGEGLDQLEKNIPTSDVFTDKDVIKVARQYAVIKHNSPALGKNMRDMMKVAAQNIGARVKLPGV